MSICHNFGEPTILLVSIKTIFMKVTWSLVGMTDGSGSTGGQTAFKSLGGSTIRKRVVPVNRRSAKQMSSRNRTALNAQNWSGLTELQRQSWITGAPNFPVVKKGVTHILRGNTLFTKLNNNLRWAGQTPITTCPLPVSMPTVSIVSAAAAAGAGTFTITYSAATVPSGFTLMLRATPGQKPGRYNISNKLTGVGPITLTASVADIFTAYTAEVGPLVAGERIMLQSVLISNTTGEKSAPSVVFIIVAA